MNIKISSKLTSPFSTNSILSSNLKLRNFNLLKEQNQILNYKNIFLLRKYISIDGKILPRRLTNLGNKKQRYISKIIKTARIVGFLPFINQVPY